MSAAFAAVHAGHVELKSSEESSIASAFIGIRCWLDTASKNVRTESFQRPPDILAHCSRTGLKSSNRPPWRVSIRTVSGERTPKRRVVGSKPQHQLLCGSVYQMTRIGEPMESRPA